MGGFMQGGSGGLTAAGLDSPVEYVAYRMKVSPADAEALVAAVYALAARAAIVGRLRGHHRWPELAARMKLPAMAT